MLNVLHQFDKNTLLLSNLNKRNISKKYSNEDEGLYIIVLFTHTYTVELLNISNS